MGMCMLQGGTIRFIYNSYIDSPYKGGLHGLHRTLVIFQTPTTQEMSQETACLSGISSFGPEPRDDS